MANIDSISNAATWTDFIEFYDEETGEPMFTEATVATHPDDVTIKLRDRETNAIVLEGSLIGGEVEIYVDGIVQFTFSATAMSAVTPKTYDVGVLYDQDDEITQVILGSISVLKGL